MLLDGILWSFSTKWGIDKPKPCIHFIAIAIYSARKLKKHREINNVICYIIKMIIYSFWKQPDFKFIPPTELFSIHSMQPFPKMFLFFESSF